MDCKGIKQTLIAGNYKFLGWMNNWNHIYFDKDGNQTEDPQLRKSFGYTKEEQPEYHRCVRELKHTPKNYQCTPSGSENIYMCGECNIYWKVDSSG